MIRKGSVFFVKRKCLNSEITVAHINIQSLNDRKQELLEAWLCSEKGRSVKVLCITEHHRVNCDLNRMSLKDFVLASSFCRENRKSRGGVCIYVHNSLKFDELPSIKKLSISNVLEVCGINLYNFYIVCAYRPKTLRNDNFIDNLENILSHILSKVDRKFLLCGDFNVNLLVDGLEARDFLCLLNSFGAEAFVKEPTRITDHSSTCIDNMISNVELRNVKVVELGISDHCLQHATLEIKIKSNSGATFKQVRDFSKTNIDELKNFLESVNWDPIYRNPDVDASFNTFHDIFLSAIDRFCPLKRVRMENKCFTPKWITPGIRKSCETKRELFIQLKQSKDKAALSNHYRNYCSILHKVISYAKKKDNEYLILNSNNQIKSIWNLVNKTVKGQKKSKFESYKGLTDGVETIENELDAPDLFNTFFSIGNNSNMGNSRFENIELPAYIENSMFVTPLTKNELLKLVSNLNNKKACGYDGLPIFIIKNVIEVIADMLVHLINLSINTGTFPTRLKRAQVIPLHKGDSTLDVCNYRPIALLPTLSKIFEKYFSDRLAGFLARYKILSKNQFGFQKGRSTSDAVFDMMDFVAESLNIKSNVMTVLLDLSKAFDSVNHQILANILERYGIRGNCLDWLKSYLNQRNQSVLLRKFDDKTKTISHMESLRIETTRGVPQGSVLGPLLFILYINHLPEIIENKITMFADDVSVFFKFERKDNTHLSKEISQTVTNIAKWLQGLDLRTNASKSKLIHFRNYNTPQLVLDIAVENTEIALVNHARFLGVIADEYMNWKKHIEALEGKLSSFCYALRCLSKITTARASLQAYYAFFHSRILYGLILWGGSVDVKKIFILQKRCIRILSGIKSNRVSCRDLFLKLKIHSITALYIIELCKLVRRHPDKFPISDEWKSSRLRDYFRLNLKSKPCRTTSYSKSTSHMAISIYNKLPTEIKDLSGNRFLKSLKQYLLVMCPYNLNEYFENSKKILIAL